METVIMPGPEAMTKMTVMKLPREQLSFMAVRSPLAAAQMRPGSVAAMKIDGGTVIIFGGNIEAKGTDPGLYPMGLNADLFAYFDLNLAVTFLVTDGWLVIRPVSIVSGHKIWNDNDNEKGARPEYIIIRLLANGEEITQKPVFAEDDWSWSFGSLPKYAGDNEIEYTIKEDALEHYESEINGYDVTNTYIPTRYSITYDLNGGTYEGQSGQIVETYNEGEEIFIHAAPTRPGYVFLFWRGSVYYPGDPYPVNENHTFTAEWKKEDPTPVPPYIPPRTAIE